MSDLPCHSFFADPGKPALIGVVHLDPLPGAPRFGGDVGVVIENALTDAQAIVEGGFDGLIVENFGDTPFWKDRSPPETIASMTRCIVALREAFPGFPFGVNVLRNDADSALAIAVATGARMIRVNVLVGVAVTDQGLIEGNAAQLLRKRCALGANVAIWADVAVKHAAPLAEQPLDQVAKDTVMRGMADAVIVTGTGTGQPTSLNRLALVRDAVAGTPTLVGSGATPDAVRTVKADGFIIGTGLKHNGRVHLAAVRTYVQARDNRT